MMKFVHDFTKTVGMGPPVTWLQIFPQYKNDTLFRFDHEEEEVIALTIDDGLCASAKRRDEGAEVAASSSHAQAPSFPSHTQAAPSPSHAQTSAASGSTERADPASLAPDVLDLLSKYNARATFFLITDHCQYEGCEDHLKRLLEEGHEVGNHGHVDKPLQWVGTQEFERIVDECNAFLTGLEDDRHGAHMKSNPVPDTTGESSKSVLLERRMPQGGREQSGVVQQKEAAQLGGRVAVVDRAAPEDGASRRVQEVQGGEGQQIQRTANTSSLTPRLFRAPCGMLSPSMARVLTAKGIQHVLGDCYCDDLMMPDTDWIARTMSQQAKRGSILIMHMPERSRRSHLLEALDKTLNILVTQRKFKVVTVGEMIRRQRERQCRETAAPT
ncbi:unnamed protein product [Amoebophrya sp. A25]|nr:unnamed protein product [Amoebophrya sp. A25]|eukprot:GSA25T00006278001.1